MMIKNKSFIIFGGSELPWIYPIGKSISSLFSTSFISLSASYLFFCKKITDSSEIDLDNLSNIKLFFPPGFNNIWSKIFFKYICKKIENVVLKQTILTQVSPYVITPYYHFFKYIKHLKIKKLIYLNYDDYSNHSSDSLEFSKNNESDIVNHSRFILCSSNYQTIKFKKLFPNKYKEIYHFPHGVNSEFINNESCILYDKPAVCVMGSLSVRYDWFLIHYCASKLQNVNFYFVGNIDLSSLPDSILIDWKTWMKRTLSLSNVFHIKNFKYSEYYQYYWRCHVNWMPYNSTLNFVRASCPLKLMDGIASGRPVVSSDVPECRLYPSLVHIYNNSEEALLLLSKLIELGDVINKNQILFAKNNTWQTRVADLLKLIDREDVNSN